MKKLHNIPLEASEYVHEYKDEMFPSFVTSIRENIVESHMEFTHLPEHMIEELEDYVPEEIHLLFKDTEFRYIHNDINSRHIIGEFDEENSWKVNGIIDFDDAMV